VNRQLVFTPRPDASLGPDLFSLRSTAIPSPSSGQVLVRNLVCSCDPTQVGWLMSDTTYARKLEPGQVMRAWCAGHVVDSRHPNFRPGDRVWGTMGWEDYSLSDGTGVLPLTAIPDDIPLSYPLGVTGINGVTAFVGVNDICATRAGDRAVVSTAAGATGSAAVQIARNLGARVIGIAGGPDKCAWLKDVLGVDAGIDYKHDDLAARLTELAPEGVDVYFDNVGGATLDTVLGAMASEGRIALCGATSVYSGGSPAFRNVGQILARTLSLRGFVLFQSLARFDAISERLYQWVREGKLVAKEDIAHGLESAPTALLRLFQGLNVGKQLVQFEGAAELEPKLCSLSRQV
jgi:NADPH-dependent curcumin reductase